jgi:hypothetical protein
MTNMWDLGDLVGQQDIAEIYGVKRATVANWIIRYADFPAELIRVSGAPVFSKRQVFDWAWRKWPNGQPSAGRPRGVPQK